MISSENTLTHAFFKSFSERIIHILKIFKQTTHEIAPILQFCENEFATGNIFLHV